MPICQVFIFLVLFALLLDIDVKDEVVDVQVRYYLRASARSYWNFHSPYL